MSARVNYFQRVLDLRGSRFGSLTAIERCGTHPSGAAQWRCRCDCGQMLVTTTKLLRAGERKRCDACSANKRRESGLHVPAPDRPRSQRAATRAQKFHTLDEAWAEIKARERTTPPPKIKWDDEQEAA